MRGRLLKCQWFLLIPVKDLFFFRVAAHFGRPKQIAYWGAGGLTILMILIWPLLMLEAIKLDESR